MVCIVLLLLAMPLDPTRGNLVHKASIRETNLYR